MENRNEAKKVKITKLIVNKLHGRYNYDVKFNDDLTFLFGSNGSGKTTVLDILSSIITGELYRLFNYTFDSIVLHYTDEDAKEDSISINLINTPENSSLDLSFNKAVYSIPLIEYRNDHGYPQPLQSKYFRANPVLKKIENLFPFIYLPLNRKGSNIRKDIRYRGETGDTYVFKNADEFAYDVDVALFEAKNKIIDSQLIANQRKQELDRNFRDDLFKSLITMENKDIWSELKEIDLEEFETLLNDYTQTIKNMGVLDKNEFNKFTTENKNLVKSVNAYVQSDKKTLSAALALSFYRAWQAREIVELTKVLQDNLEKEERKLSSFMKTINSFFGDGEDAVTKKSLHWNAGKITFRNVWNTKDIDLVNLSSGEKQLFIFFANLIFSLEDNQPGILVVDEPELSLHLAWQREYVNRIINLNPNVQIIFATHAPELVGRYKNNMEKLCPTLTNEEGV